MAKPPTNRTSTQAAMQAASALHRTGRLAEAEAAYMALLKGSPANVDLLQVLGLVCAQQRRYSKAVDWLQRALALDDSQPLTHCNLGSALLALGRADEASAAFSRAIA